MNEVKLWTKNFMTGTFTNFFLMLNYYLLVVIMTMFAMIAFAAGPSISGFTSSIFVIGSLVARLYCGGKIEKIGRKKLLLIGSILGLVMTLTYFISVNVWVLLAIRFFHGLAYGIAATAIGTIVIDIVPKSRQGEGIGYYMLSLTLASAIGPFLGMFLIQHGGFSLIFIVCTVASLLSFGNAFLLQVPQTQPVAAHTEKKKFQWSDFIETKAIPISLVSALIYFCYSGILSFLTPYSVELHAENAASFFFVVYSVAILISRPFTGRLFDRKGERITMYPALIAFAVGMVILSQTHYGLTLLLAAAFLGFGVGVVQSCGLAIAVSLTTPQRLGIANSTFYIFMDGGIGIGPFILGFFVPLIGYRGMYGALAAVTVVGIFFYALAYRYGKKVRHTAMAIEKGDENERTIGGYLRG